MMKEYLKKLFGYILATTISAVISTLICQFIGLQGITAILINAMICAVMTGMTFGLLFRKSDEFQRSLNIIDRITGYRFKLSKLVGK